MSALWATFRRDFALAWGAGGGALAPIGYFLGAATLLPLAMGTDRALLEAAGPPLVWIAAALAILATLERLFQADLEDGSLDQMLLSPAPLELIVLMKGAALWCAVGLPLALAGAPAAIALQAPTALVPAIVASLALGTAAFIGLGLVGAAVTAGVKRGGVLDRAHRAAVLRAADHLRRGCRGRGRLRWAVSGVGGLHAWRHRSGADRGGRSVASASGVRRL